VLATLVAGETSALREAGEPLAAALNGGYHLAYVIGALLAVAAIAAALTVLRSERPQAAHGAPAHDAPGCAPEPAPASAT
jgi:hypothetical protein